MENKEYQEKAHSFAVYKDSLYPILGLAEEAGEVAGKVAKHLRSVGRLNADAPDAPFAEALRKEIGDVCWFVAEICTMYGWSLGDVMQENIDKLTERKATNTICGSGETVAERKKNG